jgi:hypothetical protein
LSAADATELLLRGHLQNGNQDPSATALDDQGWPRDCATAEQLLPEARLRESLAGWMQLMRSARFQLRAASRMQLVRWMADSAQRADWLSADPFAGVLAAALLSDHCLPTSPAKFAEQPLHRYLWLHWFTVLINGLAEMWLMQQPKTERCRRVCPCGSNGAWLEELRWTEPGARAWLEARLCTYLRRGFLLWHGHGAWSLLAETGYQSVASLMMLSSAADQVHAVQSLNDLLCAALRLPSASSAIPWLVQQRRELGSETGTGFWWRRMWWPSARLTLRRARSSMYDDHQLRPALGADGTGLQVYARQAPHPARVGPERACPRLWPRPRPERLMPLSMLRLPATFQDLLLSLMHQGCADCGQRNEHTVLCLLCGSLCCYGVGVGERRCVEPLGAFRQRMARAGDPRHRHLVRLLRQSARELEEATNDVPSALEANEALIEQRTWQPRELRSLSDETPVGGCYRHATVCPAGGANGCRSAPSAVGLFLHLTGTHLVLIHGSRRSHLGSVYLDAHGEEDHGLRRGRPLRLSQSRIANLQALWIGMGFYHDTPTLRNSALDAVRW